MEENIKIDVQEAIFDANDEIATETKALLTSKRTFGINVLGGPGVGKTSTLISLISKLKAHKCYVLEGDIESDFDTQTLTQMGISTIQINTHGSCHLDAPIISDSLEKLDVTAGGILFIENIGNLVCPAEFNIGEHIKLLISTVTEGSDKPYKYPLAFENADIIIVNKVDLMPYVNFDKEFYLRGVRMLNKNAPVFFVSSTQNTGFEEVVEWLRKRIQSEFHEK